MQTSSASGRWSETIGPLQKGTQVMIIFPPGNLKIKMLPNFSGLQGPKWDRGLVYAPIKLLPDPGFGF